MGTILYCLRLTLEITVMLKLAVTMCPYSIRTVESQNPIRPENGPCVPNQPSQAENGLRQFHVIGLFFVPSTFHERHVHSMTKRVLDDLVDQVEGLLGGKAATAASRSAGADSYGSCSIFLRLFDGVVSRLRERAVDVEGV